MSGGISGLVIGAEVKAAFFKYGAIIILCIVLPISFGLWWSNRSLNSEVVRLRQENLENLSRIKALEEGLEVAELTVNVMYKQCKELKEYELHKPSRPGVDSTIDEQFLEELFGSLKKKDRSK